MAYFTIGPVTAIPAITTEDSRILTVTTVVSRLHLRLHLATRRPTRDRSGPDRSDKHPIATTTAVTPQQPRRPTIATPAVIEPNNTRAAITTITDEKARRPTITPIEPIATVAAQQPRVTAIAPKAAHTTISSTPAIPITEQQPSIGICSSAVTNENPNKIRNRTRPHPPRRPAYRRRTRSSRRPKAHRHTLGAKFATRRPHHRR